MRYFIVNYARKANGQIDEAVSVSKKIKTRDWQTASVILDFQDLKVLLATLDGVTLPRDFNRIASFYRQHYANVIDRLCKENNKEFTTVTPDAE